MSASIRSTVNTELLSGLIKDVGGHAMIMVLDFAKLIEREFTQIAALTKSSRLASAAQAQAQSEEEDSSDELQLVSFDVDGPGVRHRHRRRAGDRAGSGDDHSCAAFGIACDGRDDPAQPPAAAGQPAPHVRPAGQRPGREKPHRRADA